MKLLKLFIPLLASSLLLGCASTTEQAVQYDKDNDPRVGEEVRQVCFTRSIDGWSNVDNDRHAVLLHMNNQSSYKLSLVGSCDADHAMMGVAVITRTPNSCLTKGDKIATDAQLNRYSTCVVTHIYEWDKDAGNGLDAGNSPAQTSE